MMRVPLRIALSRAAGLPRTAWGTAIAQFGIAVTLLGVIAAGTWGTERIVATRSRSTNEAALMARGFGQLYLSLGDSEADGSLAVRLYYKPLVLLIWIGAVIMMLGGAAHGE